jgi:toxin ParE1/3/4
MKLIWTDPSIEDLRSIQHYIARDSDYYAADFVEQVILSVERLLRFPRLGRAVPEAQDENIRELVYQNYRVILPDSGRTNRNPYHRPRQQRAAKRPKVVY